MIEMSLDVAVVKMLAQEALAARANSYAPYSGYTVGAALLAEDGRVYRGCNIENASYGATNCAERTAIFKAVSEGNVSFKAIAVAGGMRGSEPVDYAYPCGICRQVIKEFCEDDFKIYAVKSSADIKEFALSELLPYGFGGGSIR